MNPDVKQLWVDELRSGIPQTTGVLKRTEAGPDPEETVGECCLGVLCRLAVENGVNLTFEEENGAVSYDGQRYYLPRAVQDWAGIEVGNPTVTPSAPIQSLGHYNDSGADFEEIAVLIEDNL